MVELLVGVAIGYAVKKALSPDYIKLNHGLGPYVTREEYNKIINKKLHKKPVKKKIAKSKKDTI